MNIASGETKTLTSGGSEEVLKGKLDWVYPEELDARTAYWWSPDSKKIAYYEMDERPVTRYPIMDMSSPTGGDGVHALSAGGRSESDCAGGSGGCDGRRGGRRGSGNAVDGDGREHGCLSGARELAAGQPQRGDPAIEPRAESAGPAFLRRRAAGASKTVLTETDKYWINISDDLYFFSDNKRFLWSSERTGYRHFYLYENSGKQIAQLTSGDWAISDLGGFGPGSANHPAVDEARGYVYFLSNKDDVRETQLYRVSLADKSVTRITQDSGSHSVKIAPDNLTFIDSYSNVTTPTRQDLERMDGTRVAVINEDKIPELAEYRLSPVEFVEVQRGRRHAAERFDHQAAGFRSHEEISGAYLRVRRAARAIGAQYAWGGGGYLWHEILAEKGYIIFSLDNRGSWGRGHAFETPIYHHMGKIELQDQLAGVKYLKSLGYVDAARIGITGGSYGGYMTLVGAIQCRRTFSKRAWRTLR